MSDVKEIPIELIRTDGGTQIRACETFQTKVDEYYEAMVRGDRFPPLTVFWDGAEYWLADGFHRHGAYNIVMQGMKLPGLDIECDVIAGTQRDAIMFACGTNAVHGIPRTNSDKQNAVNTMLKNPLVSHDENGVPWSDRAIAKICKVSHHTVAKWRAELVTGQMPSERAYTNKHGGQSTMNTGGINQGRQQSEQPTEQPDARPEAAAETPTEPKPEPETRPVEQEPSFVEEIEGDEPDDEPELIMGIERVEEREMPEPAAPTGGEVVRFKSRWDYLHDRLKEIDRAIAALPEPHVVAEEFPTELAHAMTMDRVLEIQRWWLDFARFWQARQPEFQRVQQRQRDFIQEEFNAKSQTRPR